MSAQPKGKLHYARSPESAYTICGIFITLGMRITHDPAADGLCRRCEATATLDVGSRRSLSDA